MDEVVMTCTVAQEWGGTGDSKFCEQQFLFFQFFENKLQYSFRFKK